MVYYYDCYNEEKRDFDRTEITREKAKWWLEGHYKVVEVMLDTPGYYRLPQGMIEVKEG